MPLVSLTTTHPFVGQPNVGKSSLLNAIFGMTRVRASRTPGKVCDCTARHLTPDRTISRRSIFRPSSGPPMSALLTVRDSLCPHSYQWISRYVYLSPFPVTPYALRTGPFRRPSYLSHLCGTLLRTPTCSTSSPGTDPRTRTSFIVHFICVQCPRNGCIDKRSRLNRSVQKIYLAGRV
jgi:GTPase SAR1 family protein